MKDLNVQKFQNEVTVFTDGSTKIAQRKLARLLGVSENALTGHVTRRSKNINTSKGLDEKTALKVALWYAYESKTCTEEAKQFVQAIGTGGMRAFNYSQAGYKLQAVPKTPTALEAARATVLALEQVETLSLQVDEDAILTNKSNEYYPLSHVKKLNPTLKLSGQKLGKMSEELGYEVKKLFSNYDTVVTNTYSGSVWLALYPEVVL
jgi:hypothetical protein